MEKSGIHTQAAFTDKRSVGIVETILSAHARVMPDLRSGDSWPNIDGYLEVIDSFRQPAGKLEAQVKTLQKSGSLVHKCPRKFLSYCYSDPLLPVLLMVVDREAERVYWVHISEELLAELGFPDNPGAKSLHLQDEQSFTAESAPDYAEEWLRICDQYRRDSRELQHLRSLQDELVRHANPATGLEQEAVSAAHAFVDTFNRTLERDLPVVRERLYGDPWKIGLAFAEWQQNAVTFAMLPLRRGTNQLLLQAIDGRVLNELGDSGLMIHRQIGANQFEDDPVAFAYETALKTAQGLAEHGDLSFPNQQIAIEFLFAWIDKHQDQLGVSEAVETLRVEDLERFSTRTLTLWVDEALKYLLRVDDATTADIQELTKLATGDRLHAKEYFDPSFLRSQMGQEKVVELASTAAERAGSDREAGPHWPVGNKKLPLRLAREFVDDLKGAGIQEISRPYPALDFARIRGRGGLIYNLLTTEALVERVRWTLNHLPEAYDGVVAANFPGLRDALDPWSDYDSVGVALTNVEDWYESSVRGPGFLYRGLRASRPDQVPRRLILATEEISGEYDSPREVCLEGKTFIADEYAGSCGSDEFFGRIPLLNCVCATLANGFKQLTSRHRGIGWSFYNLNG